MSYWRTSVTQLQTQTSLRLWLLVQLVAVCIIGLSISSCGTQDKTGSETTKPEAGHVSKKVTITPGTQPAIDPSAVEVQKPALNLSLDKLPDENADAINFDVDQRFAEDDSPLAATLNKKQPDKGVKLGGKLFTDETKLQNKEYLDSVDGVQLNVEGNFD